MCACMLAVVEDSEANVGLDYPPPLPLWSAANGTNCTVLSLMHWQAFSISVLLSWVPPPKPPSSPFTHITHPISVGHVEAMCGTTIGQCKSVLFFLFVCFSFCIRSKVLLRCLEGLQMLLDSMRPFVMWSKWWESCESLEADIIMIGHGRKKQIVNYLAPAIWYYVIFP